MDPKGDFDHQSDGPKGFDFGAPARSVLIGNLDLAETLSDAAIFACSYGSQWYEPLRSQIPLISIIGTNDDALRKAFAVFREWGADDDGDVVSLTFVFLKDGGYLLGLTQEHDRLQQRLSGFNRVFDAIQCSHTWVKKFDSRHTILGDIAEYKEYLVSPVFFSAARHPPTSDPSQLSPERVSSVNDVRPIIKFECQFVHEQDVEKNTQAWVSLLAYRKNDAKDGESIYSDADFVSQDKRPYTDPQIISKRRAEILSRHFPVTLARLRTCSRLQDISRDLITKGGASWQIEQAVSNLVLSNDMIARRHYGGILHEELPKKILEAMNGRYEVADNISTLDSFTREVIIAQIKYDAVSLLSTANINANTERLSELIDLLTREGFLCE